jgi:hypothetical protein
MKSFHLTVWGVIVLFALIMGTVAIGAFTRKGNICKIDPAQIQQIRAPAL